MMQHKGLLNAAVKVALTSALKKLYFVMMLLSLLCKLDYELKIILTIMYEMTIMSVK